MIADELVVWARTEYALGDTTMKAIADELGVSKQAVCNILHGKTRSKCGGPGYKKKEKKRTVVAVKKTDNDRILGKININEKTGCWEWSGATSGGGYGVCRVGGSNVYSHRLSYSTFVGDIPDWMCVCHSCDNPPCVNPDHLWIGTQSDNILDSVKKGRWHGNTSKRLIKHEEL